MPDEEAKLPLLERWGRSMLRSDRVPRPASETNPIHLLDEDEQRALRRIEQGAVLRAALAGALSALASGVTEAVAGVRLHLDRAPTPRELATYWGLYGVVTLVASIAEIVYLYWDALRAVRGLANGAGLHLGASPDVASALARAALELPDPQHPVLGVDPRRESNKAMLLVASLVYKAKIGLSSFLFKVVVRRALGRLATRQLLAFAAVPVNALWNGLVTFLVLREARVRAMGPSAVAALVPELLRDPASLSDVARRACARAVAAAIVRSAQAHPNLVLLLQRVLAEVGPLPSGLELDDTRLFLADLRALDEGEQDLVLRLTILAAALDGRIAGNERKLLEQALVASGRSPDLAPAFALRRAFVRGKPLDLARLVHLRKG